MGVKAVGVLGYLNTPCFVIQYHAAIKNYVLFIRYSLRQLRGMERHPSLMRQAIVRNHEVFVWDGIGHGGSRTIDSSVVRLLRTSNVGRWSIATGYSSSSEKELEDDVTDEGDKGGVESCSVRSRRAAQERPRGIAIAGLGADPMTETGAHSDKLVPDRGEVDTGDLRYGDQAEPSDAPTCGSGVH